MRGWGLVGRSTDPVGLGSRMAEVAGDGCYGGLYWVFGWEVCGGLSAKREEDRYEWGRGGSYGEGDGLKIHGKG